MKEKSFELISSEEIDYLIQNSVRESKNIEFKEFLKISTDKEKKEFLFDITSFANSSGGDLIFGIKEDRATGCAQEIVGITIENFDRLELQLRAIINDSINPRIANIKIKSITHKDKNILVIRVPQSWNKPHQVTFQGTDKFYTRDNNGKRKIDVFELRNLFVSNEFLSERIKSFKVNRINEIVSNSSAIKLLDYGKIIIHITPMVSFNQGYIIDLPELIHLKTNSLLYPLMNYGIDSTYRYNFDGIVCYVMNGKATSPSYLQLFRNGIIETVNSWMIQSFGHTPNTLDITAIEEMIIKFMRSLEKIFQFLKIESQFNLSLTITGTAGFGSGSKYFGYLLDNPIEKDTLIFPDLLVTDFSKIDFEIKPWFDALRNAVGEDSCVNYVGENWVKK